MAAPDDPKGGALAAAFDRLSTFANTHGDYIAPLLEAYGRLGGSRASYQAAVDQLREDLQLVLAAAGEKLR